MAEYYEEINIFALYFPISGSTVLILGMFAQRRVSLPSGEMPKGSKQSLVKLTLTIYV